MNILVVDDSKNWIKFHIKCLNQFFNRGVNIDYAFSANDGFSLATSKRYDLIITDLQMELDFEPEHAGEWLVQNISNTINKFAKILIVSASSDIKFVANKLNVEFLSKANASNSIISYKLKLEELLN